MQIKEKEIFEKAREKYKNAIYDNLNIDTFSELSYALKDVLPAKGWISNIPDTLREWIDLYDFNKYETVYFSEIIDNIISYKNWYDRDKEGFNKYHQYLEGFIISVNIDDVINETIDYIKEHNICGTILDW